MPDWKESIARWRQLPESEKYRLRVLSIPRKLARSMAFEGEPVPIEMLEAQLEESCPHLFRRVIGATSVRFLLIDLPLPRIEDSLRIGECFRQAVMSIAGEALGKDKIPPFLSGHNLPAGNRHGHAFYLPEDADGDGRIDHIAVYVPGGIDWECHRVLVRLTRLWNRNGQGWRALLETISDATTLAGSSVLFNNGESWTSTTPYLHPWHIKKNLAIEDQIRRECRERSLPEIARLMRLPSIRINGRERRPIHFRRFRSKRGLNQPDTHGSFWRIEFAEPVQGPLALGFACHFGLGLFVPASDD
jgi:CRISPR-associated protein Csb2